MLPDCLVIPEILQAFRITSDRTNAKFTFRNSEAETFEITLVPTSEQQLTSGSDLAGKGVPLYLEHPGKHYWFKYLEGDHLVYFQYNSCQDMREQSFTEFSDGLFSFIESKPVEKLVLDIRHNGGGNSSVAEPFLSRIGRISDINRSGHFFVVIGRHTFSSGLLNAMRLQKETSAILIGEATGGKPNHYGEVRNFRLPNSKLEVGYSTKYYVTSEKDLPSLIPDITTEASSSDYYSGRDPILEKTLTM